MNRIKGTILACAAAVLAATGARAEVKLGANCLMSSVGYGMYSMNASSNINFTKMAETVPLFGGAVYVNGKYYGTYYDYEYVSSAPQLTEVSWYTYDPVTWQVESKVSCPLDYTYIASDRTYDPSSGKVYSLVYDKTGSAVWLATTNLQTGASTMIAPVENNVFTIASDARGNLYGINVNAKLYSINPATGATTLIGATNVMDDWESDYQQSMTFDYETGKLYWAEFHSLSYFTSASALYEIDPATAKATKIADIPGGPELTGLYVMPSVADGAPGVATDLKAETQSTGSTNVKLSFKAPTNSSDGKALDVNTAISFELVIDNELVDIADVKPGAIYSSDWIATQRGYHSFKVTGTNSKGTGETASTFFYAGYDVPQAPKNVTLTSDGETATLTWTAPGSSEGAQGGPVRTPYTYNVVRYPGAVKVASGTSALTVTDTPGAPALYYYEVSAVSADGEGPAAQSNKLVIALYDTPYTCGFDTEDDFNMYTIVDVTSNGKVWNYDEDRACLRHPWSLSDPIDDYIISPAIKLNGEKSYSVSFDAWQWVAGYDEHVMLYYGTSPDVNSMKLILDTQRLNEESTNYQAVVAALANGAHYFAFRSKTGVNGFMSYVDNFRVVESGMATIPEKVDGLKATAANGGKLEVSIEFEAPTVNLQGQPLSSLSYIDIIRGEGTEPIKTFTNPTPGEHLSWTDSSVRTGAYTYRVVAANTSGEGQAATASVYAGVDTPKPVENLTLSTDGDCPTLVWDAPKEGVNGGNLNGLLSYDVVRVVNETPQTVATGIASTSYEDTWKAPGQAYVYYTVTAVTTAGRSEAAKTDGYTAGEAYTIPFVESFAGGQATNQPWLTEQVTGTQGSWTIVSSGEYPYVSAQDKDGGLATFDGWHSWTSNCELRLISPSISTIGYKNLILTFYSYHYNGVDSWSGESEPVNETFCIEVSVNGGAFKKVDDSDFRTYGTTNGWEQKMVYLEDCANQKDVRFAVRGKGAGCFNIHVDNFRLDGSSMVGTVDGADARLKVRGRTVSYNELDAPLYIYSVSGMKVAESCEKSGAIELEPGFYVATSGSSNWKFSVR